MSTEQDDWEVAVDTGEFDKRLEQLERDRAATQEPLPSSTFVNRNASATSSTQFQKPIRILKRPTGPSQTPVNTDSSSSSVSNSPFPDETPASFTSIATRPPARDAPNSSATSTKPTIKTYEQREQEYRLARLRIMGEEESSVKDGDDDVDNCPPESSKTRNTLDSSCQPPSHGANPVSSSSS